MERRKICMEKNEGRTTMINAIKYRVFTLFSSKLFRSLMTFVALLLLSGCGDNDSDTSAGKEGNIEAQTYCWQAPIAWAVTDMLNQLYDKSVDKVTSGGGNIILIAFAIWMAFKLLKVLGSFKEENLGEVWTEIIQKATLCAVCFYFVSNTNNIASAFNTFVLPIYRTILELGTEAVGPGDSITINLGIFGELTFGSSTHSCPAINTNLDMNQLSETVNGISTCMICRINSRLNVGVQIGINLIASMRIGAILVGIALIIFFTATKLFFVFFLIDSLFRLNFAAYLLPVLIMGIPFNYTRKWSKHGFLMFLNSSGIMLFIGLLINVAVNAIQAIVSGDGERYDYEAFENSGIALLVILLIAVLLMNIPAMGVALADKFIGGGGGMEFQQKVQKFVMNMIKKAGSSALSVVTSGTSSLITKTMEKHEETRQMLTNFNIKRDSLSKSISALGGHNDDN